MISFSARYLRRTCICIYFWNLEYLTINQENRPQLSVRAEKKQKLEDVTEAEPSYSC